MKVIKKINSTSVDASVIVLLDEDYEEFRVELRVKGRHQKAADYFTSDRKDALGTAAAMLAQHEPKAVPA